MQHNNIAVNFKIVAVTLQMKCLITLGGKNEGIADRAAGL